MINDIPKPEELAFLKEKKHFLLKGFTPKRASIKKKLLLETAGERYFLKYVRKEIAEQVAEISLEISQNSSLQNYFPTLIASEKGWLIYKFIEGEDFLKYVIRHLFSQEFEKTLPLFHSLGKCLSLFHQMFTKEFVNAKEELEPYFTQINMNGSHNDLIDELPLVKTYNDFTMRNVLLLDSKQILCLDLDAAFHRKFPKYMLPYHDIGFTVLNILSLSIIPVFLNNRIEMAVESFLKGYFENNDKMTYSKYLLQLFLVFHYHGLFADRNLNKLYPGLKHTTFRNRIANAVANNAFNFLPTTLTQSPQLLSEF